ncbi:FliM/FliN family flagellar motor C-terminal domain-containing protein [unidentified bacterial endosymbiont]|uniref:FliM/FliN family flagellar motor C-terminal domain-containing protein n=1 Tax=unidentified bacterial endosymbiont TaxID=2355 RepID=UPI00209F763B|nr:FliM/FliN family flagellar motor C-terminal domain-containing protein [unidentified bacterial endosymbiont]
MQYSDEPSSPPAALDPADTARIRHSTEQRQGTPQPAVRFAVTVECLVTQLTLEQLRSLAPGQPLVPSMPLTPDDLILQINGSRLGRGSLLTLDKRWAIRITQLGAAGEAI